MDPPLASAASVQSHALQLLQRASSHAERERERVCGVVERREEKIILRGIYDEWVKGVDRENTILIGD